MRIQLAVALVLLALGVLFWGTYDAYQTYVFGTEVTATVERCPAELLTGARNADLLPCQATWTVDGRQHEGDVVGKSLGTKGERVRAWVLGDDKVRPVGPPRGDALFPLVAAGLLIVVPAGLLAYTGYLAGKPVGRARRQARMFGGVALVGTSGVAAFLVGLCLLGIAALDTNWPVVGWAVGLLAVAVWPAGRLRWLNRRIETAGVAMRDAAEDDETKWAGEFLATGERPPPEPARPGRHPDPPLADVVADAIRRAASSAEPVTTGRLLATLASLDIGADWQRIWLATSAPESIGLADEPDPALWNLAADWQGIPISDSLARALTLAEWLCQRYELAPAGSGTMTLALVAERGDGATEALLRGGLPHATLLDLIQRDLLKLRLDGLSHLIPAARR